MPGSRGGAAANGPRPLGVALVGGAWLGLLLTTARPSCAWQTFSTNDGLAHNQVLCLVEDRAGNLWFGTNGAGVSRYDGATWRTFNTADELGDGRVHCLIQDGAGNLWFGTDFGVSRYDGTSWRTFNPPTPDGPPGYNIVYSLLEDRAQNMWIGTFGGGVSRYDGTSWRTFNTADGLASNDVFSIVEDRVGNLWFGTDTGVSRYDGATWRTFTTADGLASNDVRCLLQDRAGNVWIGTFGGVSRYDGTSWRTFTTADGMASNYVFSLLEDRAGNVWLGTAGGGVSRYDGTSWRTFSTADGLASNVVYSLLEDRAGNLWFGTSSGASRHDGVAWRSFTTADGLADDSVRSVLEDRAGNLWFGTSGGGASRYDGATWRTFTVVDGLADNSVRSVLEDRAGNLWFGTNGGVSRYDGATWRSFTVADGLAGNVVYSLLEDHAGNLWFGTDGGASRYDGVTLRTFTVADGLAGNAVYALLEDHAGTLWFGTNRGASSYDGTTWRNFLADRNSVLCLLEDHTGNLWFGTLGGGASRYDGTTWRTFTTTDGLAYNEVYALLEDRSGNLWFGTYGGGASHYDGANWRTFSEPDGLAGNYVVSLLEDRAGSLWFGTVDGGVSRHERDRVSPLTVFLARPPRLSSGRVQSATFVAAFGEARVEFSSRLDGGAWTPWSPVGGWIATDLPDGHHLLETRSRDFLGNIEAVPAATSFEIDATAPAPTIAAPTFGQAVHGTVAIRGTASDPRFREYRVEMRPAEATSWDSTEATLLAWSAIPVAGGTLATWNTDSLSDGPYDLRLSVSDTLGLVGTALVSLILDNHAPSADRTAPATVSAARGGDVYTAGGEVHLYFPPHAFGDEALVTIAPSSPDSVPAALPSGATRVLPGYAVAWSGAALQKPARLEVSYAGVDPATVQGSLALYASTDGTSWWRVGGTVDGAASRITLALSRPGRLALYAELAPPNGDRTLSALSFTPRAFSPAGTFADREVGIAFTLGSAAEVTVRVYSRAGRLVREVAAGAAMGPGANLVRWDGRDRAGAIVVDGLYLVSVEALGKTLTRPLAVVR